MNRASPWPDTRSKTGYRLENLRIALGLLEDLLTSINVKELLTRPLDLQEVAWEIESAARRATWMERNLRSDLDCTELEACAKKRRELIDRASKVLADLGVTDAKLVVAEGEC